MARKATTWYIQRLRRLQEDEESRSCTAFSLGSAAFCEGRSKGYEDAADALEAFDVPEAYTLLKGLSVGPEYIDNFMYTEGHKDAIRSVLDDLDSIAASIEY